MSFSNLAHSGDGTLRLNSALRVTGSLNNAAGTFDANDQAVTVVGLATVAGGAYLAGTAVQNFEGGLVITGGVFTSSTGPMMVNGVVAVLGGVFRGDGSVAGSVTAIGGTVAAGAANPGILSVSGAVTFFASTTFTVLLDGPTAGTEYAQLLAGGPINLSGSTLSLLLRHEPLVESSFILMTSDFGPIAGTFAGLADGAIFTQDGFQFQITYQGGPGGNSVVVTRVA